MAELRTSRLVNNLNRAAGLSREDWRFLAIAVKELALARLRHAATAIDVIFDELQLRPTDNAQDGGAKPLGPAELRRLSWAIAAAATRVPWRSDCLLQAMAAQRWLRRRHSGADFFVGVQKDPQGALSAHAWLQRGDLTITGGAHEEFHVVLGPPGQMA